MFYLITGLIHEVPHADLLINIKVIFQEFSVISLASYCINYGILMIKLPYCWIN